MSKRTDLMKKPFIIFIFVAAALSVVLFVIVNNGSKQDPNKNNNVSTSNRTDNASSAYREYSPEAISSASQDTKIVLFFHATWCPTCRVLDQDISSNLGDIPEKVRILKVDYDSETELKQKYGVRLQHTLVQVNNSGEKVTLWHQSPTLSHLLGNLK